MQYGKYIGSLEVSVEDNILHGKLLYIKDLVTYEADSPVELERAFREAVDDYVEDCRADGVEPDVPFKGSFNVRVSPEIHRSLGVTASAQGRSLNEYVKSILEVHESISRSSSTVTHYHVNLGSYNRKGAIKHNIQDSSKKTSEDGSYMTSIQKYPNQSSKVIKCH